MESKKAADEIRQNWANPESTISFLGVSKLYDHYGGVLKRKKIEDILAGFESYSLQKEERTSGHIYDGYSLPTYIDNIVEIDSFQLSTELVASNLDVGHILCGINTFSKRLFAIPLIKRDAESGLKAIKQIFRLSKTLPDFIVSDQVFFILLLISATAGSLSLISQGLSGSVWVYQGLSGSNCNMQGGECSAKLIQNYLRSRGVQPVTVSGRHKAASVERVQRTLQKRIYTYLNEFQTNCFIPVLSDLVFNYNSTKHSTIKW